MTVRVPEYFTEFKCIADKCRDSCCIGWEIDIDERAEAKYKALGGDLGREIAEKTSHGYFPLCENGRCTFLDASGLCRIISSLGEGYLCDICNEHPRYYGIGKDGIEGGIGLGCEEAARIILSLNEVPKIVEIERDVHYSDEDVYADLSEYFREHLYKDIFTKPTDEVVRSYVYYGTMADDVAFETASTGKKALFLDTRSGNADAETVEEIYESMLSAIEGCESLTDEWDSLVEEARKIKAEDALARLDGMRGLIYYFTHRYVRSGIEDMSLYSRITFALGSSLIISAISLIKEGDDAAIRAAVEYSKNIEYSTENVDEILENLTYM